MPAPSCPYPQPLPTERGVYRCRKLLRGALVYYAIMSSGELLNGGFVRPEHGETSADVIAKLERDLNAADPPRPVLALVPSETPPVMHRARRSFSWPVRRGA